MDMNEWGDPVDTVYMVMLENTVAVGYRNWRTANEYADQKNIELLKQGHPESYWIAGHVVV
jgi:hypothetical protein